jgi:hypothetical protein
MNDYIILKKDEDNYEVLETGFSYLAFIYGPLWAAFNLLWIPLFFGLVITMSLIKFLYYLNIEQFYFLVVFFSNFCWGFLGRDLLIHKYLSNKFHPIEIIGAGSRVKALIKYLSK